MLYRNSTKRVEIDYIVFAGFKELDMYLKLGFHGKPNCTATLVQQIQFYMETKLMWLRIIFIALLFCGLLFTAVLK